MTRMTPEIRQGDCLALLADVADGTVQCCVTSPPYYGLRDYGAEGQIGLEPTPDAYVERLVEVFREVRRVLRDDGVLWLVLGDSYAGSWGNQGRKQERGTQRPINGPMLQPVHDRRYASKPHNTGKLPEGSGLKPKDLIGIPWMVAFALRADGWYLRQDIIWHKPNPMPESVRDRCTKAHEYVFMLTKSARYWFDAEAIKEDGSYPVPADRNVSGVYSEGSGRNDGGKHRSGGFVNNGKRNRRDVWTVTPRPYKGAHFATFPPALIEPCILASSRPGDLVLDPFAGAGTTGVVAAQHGRRALLFELNPDYCALARERWDDA